MTSERRIVRANGVDLCVESFGERADPAILLIGGASSSMDWWEDELCERLASSSRFVIRYDLRDTGQSVTYAPGAPEYGGLDLVSDAVGLLDAFGLEQAHLVGISTGGGIAQRLTLDHPERVASLTLMATSPITYGDDLPPPSPQVAAVFANPAPPPDWSDRAAVIDYIVDDLRPFAGSLAFDEDGSRALAARVVDRTRNIESSMTNHWLLDSGEAPRSRLNTIGVPTLVLHGTDDPLFPYGHAEALAREIPGARLLPLAGMGHEYPPRPLWDRVVGAILAHTDE